MLRCILTILERHTVICPEPFHTLEGHLALDPFAMMLIAAEVEEALDLEFDYDRLAGIETVAAFVTFAQQAKAAAPRSAPHQSGLHVIDVMPLDGRGYVQRT
jgi:acyl carrier protein